MDLDYFQTFRKKSAVLSEELLSSHLSNKKRYTTMAKSGNWLYGATGKIAGMSLRKDPHRGFIIRDIVTPKNPKTPKQMLQRLFMATVVLAYKYLKVVCCRSFEGIAEGFPSMCYFRRLNLNMLRQRVITSEANGGTVDDAGPFTPLGGFQLVPQPYYVSQGTLPAVTVVLPRNHLRLAQIPDVADNSYQALLDAYGLLRGDRLTFITLQGPSPDGMQCHIANVVLDPHRADGLRAPLTVPFVASDGSVNLPSPLNDGHHTTFVYHPATDDDLGHSLTYGYDTGTVTAAGIVVTRLSGTTRLHSTCQLTVRQLQSSR